MENKRLQNKITKAMVISQRTIIWKISDDSNTSTVHFKLENKRLQNKITKEMVIFQNQMVLKQKQRQSRKEDDDYTNVN